MPLFNVAYTTICQKALNELPKGLKLSHPTLIINMTLFDVTFKAHAFSSMTFNTTHIGELVKFLVLHFNVQDKDNIEHMNTKCHMFTLMINLLAIT